MAGAKEDPRFKYVVKNIAALLGVKGELVEKASNPVWVSEFLAAGTDGGEPRMALLFFLQPREGSSEPVVFMTAGDAEQLTGKCAYVIRVSDPMKELPNDVEMNLNFGTLPGGPTPMATLKGLLVEMYKPCIEANSFGFAKKMTAENRTALNVGMANFLGQLDTSIQSLQESISLPRPEEKFVNRSMTGPAQLQAAVTNPELVAAYEDCVSEWNETAVKLLNEPEKASGDDEDDIGPRTELTWWKR